MITEVVENLKLSRDPFIKKIHEENGIQIMAIGLTRGVQLGEHAIPYKAKLLVIKGEIDINTIGQSRRYACFESHVIPKNVRYNVIAWDDAIILLFLKSGDKVHPINATLNG